MKRVGEIYNKKVVEKPKNKINKKTEIAKKDIITNNEFGFVDYAYIVLGTKTGEGLGYIKISDRLYIQYNKNYSFGNPDYKIIDGKIILYDPVYGSISYTSVTKAIYTVHINGKFHADGMAVESNGEASIQKTFYATSNREIFDNFNSLDQL